MSNATELDRLLEQIVSGDIQTKERAALILGDLKDRRAVEPLINRLQKELDEGCLSGNLCFAIASTLGRLGDISALEVLLRGHKLFHGTGAGVFTGALYTLGETAKLELISRVNDEHDPYREVSFRALSYFIYREPEKYSSLIDLVLKSSTPSTRVGVIKTLDRLKGPKALKILKDALNDENGSVVREAIYVLKNYNDPSIIPELRKLAERKGSFKQQNISWAAQDAIAAIEKSHNI